MIDFQQKLQELQNSLIENIGTGKDSTIEEDSPPIKGNLLEKKEEPFILEILETTEIPIEPPIQTPLIIPFEIKNQSIQDLEERVTQLENKFSAHQKALESETLVPSKTRLNPKEENEFISMIESYLYSVIINPKLQFENQYFEEYKTNLLIISQNILANSFRFFEKDPILEQTIELGKRISEQYPLTDKSIEKIQKMFYSMQENLLKPSYQKNFYFAKLLNERGLILNSIAIINEILGEYIVESAKQLSYDANARIQVSLERLNNSQTARRGYYHLYKSASGFFYTQFSPHSTEMESSFFPYKDTGNEEIELQMNKLFQSNKRSKRDLFILYSHLIYRIKSVRNDLVHGNNQRHFHNISYEIEDVLIDFEYLAIHKNFLGA
jgi:hypothetical protein